MNPPDDPAPRGRDAVHAPPGRRPALRAAARSFPSVQSAAMLVAVEVLFLGYFAVSAVMRTWALAVIPGLLAFAALVPWWLEQAVEARLPTWLHATYLAFLLAGPFAGGRLGLYAIWPHWDKAIHTLSGFLVGSTVFLGLGVIRRRNNLPLPPYLVGAAVMATGGFVAATWEIAEYTSDRLLGTHAQNASLDDTMTDIICGLLGALIITGLAASHARWHPLPLVASLLRNRDLPRQTTRAD